MAGAIFFKRSLSETVTFESGGEKLKPSIVEREKKNTHTGVIIMALSFSRAGLGERAT